MQVKTAARYLQSTLLLPVVKCHGCRGKNEAATTRPSAPQALADEVVEDANRFTVCSLSKSFFLGGREVLILFGILVLDAQPCWS